MAETLALLPINRQERRGCGGYSDYLLSIDINAILKESGAIFLPDCCMEVSTLTQEMVKSMIESAVGSDRVEIIGSVPWHQRNDTSVSFMARIWDYPRFPGIASAEEVCLLALEHDKAFFPASCTGVSLAGGGKTTILDDAYLMRPVFKEHVLVEYDPVKAVRLMIQRLNQEGKPRKRPPPKRLSKDDYWAIVGCLRDAIYDHSAIQAGMCNVVERRWGLPRERSGFVRTLIGTSNMAEALFGRKKPWRKALKPILLYRKEVTLRALENPKLEIAERSGLDWLLKEMCAMRLPGIKTWSKRTGYQATPQ